jgi:periplasmic protein TonB
MAAFFVSPITPAPAVSVAPPPTAERKRPPSQPVAVPPPPQPMPLSTPALTADSPPEREVQAAAAPPPAPPAAAGAPSAPVAQSATSAALVVSGATAAAPLSVAIEAVRYLRPPQVVYPLLSRRMGETGRVVVRVTVDTQGVPIEVTVAEPSRYPRLNEQAVQALRQSRFEPYRVNGQPMSVTVLAPIVFTLEDRP